MSGTPIISVVVATYNRADLLDGCFNSLVRQVGCEGQYEVIIVNNNCTDNTAEIAAEYAAKYPFFKVIDEPVPGASVARNAGWREARAAYVAFMDDDARAMPDWISRAIEIIREHEPDIFGGSIYPFYLTNRPVWFKDQYEIRRVLDTPGWLNDRQYISGSNLFFQKDLLDKLGGFDTEVGPKGDAFAFGEETLLIRHAREYKPGLKAYYHPELMVEHLAPPRKMTVPHYFRVRYLIGKSGYVLFGDYGWRWRDWVGRFFLTAGRLVFKGMIKVWFRDRERYPYWQQYQVEEVAPLMDYVGRLAMLIGR
ncbi:MAG: glycosyltransferase [Nitrospirota bacterium]|nr:glycosyltransferase [Nitrospirota bacterium]